MKLYTIRHGEYVYSYDKEGKKLVHFPNSPLSPLGKLQSHQLAKELKRQNAEAIDALYTSPYRRVRETAAILVDELKIPNVIEIDGLKDVFPNSAEGKPFDELIAIGADIYAHPLGPTQEPLSHVIERAQATIQSILTEGQQKNYRSVGVVSHGDLICAIDWTLKHTVPPSSYSEMKNQFYLQKGEACAYDIDNNLQLRGEGRIITVEEVKQSTEAFRRSSNLEA